MGDEARFRLLFVSVFKSKRQAQLIWFPTV